MLQKTTWMFLCVFFTQFLFYSCSNDLHLSKVVKKSTNPPPAGGDDDDDDTGGGSSGTSTPSFFQGTWQSRLKKTGMTYPTSWMSDDQWRVPTAIRDQSQNLFVFDVNTPLDPSGATTDEWRTVSDYLRVFLMNYDIQFWVGIDVSTTFSNTDPIKDILHGTSGSGGLKGLTNSPALDGILLHEFHTKWCTPMDIEKGESCFQASEMGSLRTIVQSINSSAGLYVYTDAKYLPHLIMPGYLMSDTDDTTSATASKWSVMSGSAVDDYKDPSKTTSYVSVTFYASFSSLSASKYELSFLFSDQLTKYHGEDQNRDARVLVFVNGQYVENETGHNTSIYRASSSDKDDYIRIYKGDIKSLLSTSSVNKIEIRFACTSPSGGSKCSEYDIMTSQFVFWAQKLEKIDSLGASLGTVTLSGPSTAKVNNGVSGGSDTATMVVKNNSASLVSADIDGVVFVFAETAKEWGRVHEYVLKTTKEYLASISSGSTTKKSIELFRHYGIGTTSFQNWTSIDFEQKKRYLNDAKNNADGVLLWQFPFALYEKFASYTMTPFPSKFYSDPPQDKGVFEQKSLSLFQAHSSILNDYSAMTYYPRHAKNNIPGWFQKFESTGVMPGSYHYEIRIPSILQYTYSSATAAVGNTTEAGRFSWEFGYMESGGTSQMIISGDIADHSNFTGGYTAQHPGNFYFKMYQTGTATDKAAIAMIQLRREDLSFFTPGDWYFKSGVNNADVTGQYQCFNAFFANFPNWENYCHPL